MEKTNVGMAPTRLPLRPERVAVLKLAQRGIKLCEPLTSRGGKLLTRVFRELQAAIFQRETAEMRAERAEDALGLAKARIAKLEKELQARPLATGSSPGIEQVDPPESWSEATKVGADGYKTLVARTATHPPVPVTRAPAKVIASPATKKGTL